jgi:hypothetical protein
MIPRLLDEDRRRVTPRAARKTVITSSRMAWALFDGLRTDDPGKGLQALDAVFAYFKQRDSLTTLFNQLNHTHFNGSLPRYRVQREPMEPWRPGPDTAFVGGHCWSHLHLIVIGYGFSPRQERRTLLHEMVHVVTHWNTPAHGRAFQQELLRLADLGERWARQEAIDFERFGDAHLPLWIPRRAAHIAELWRKHGSAWRKREYLRRCRAASKAAFTRAAARRESRFCSTWDWTE